jgi:hypothetical protein
MMKGGYLLINALSLLRMPVQKETLGNKELLYANRLICANVYISKYLESQRIMR